jgi:uncharacterized paraquat-inducible protein A
MSKKAGERRYPMPCPKCRKIIDARQRFCPYCGIDTDAKLRPWAIALPAALVVAAIILGIAARAGYLHYVLLAGLGLGMIFALWLKINKR